MTYEEFISKYNDRWSGTVEDFNKLGIGRADEQGIDWLLKYQEAEDEGDIDKQTKLFPIAPLSLRQNAGYQKRAQSFFDQYIRPNYSDPVKQNQAYTAFINNSGFATPEAASIATAAKEKAGGPILPKTDAEVKVEAEKKAATKKPVGPADVKANATIPPPQKSIAEQQADYIRSRGGRLAYEADNEIEQGLRESYRKTYGYDLNTAAGRQASFEAALQRGGHNDAMARNLKAGKYAYLDPNSDAGMRASEAARQKLFAKGGNWVGDNQLTGEYMDVNENLWDSRNAYDQSGMNPNAPKVEPLSDVGMTPEQQAASNVRSLVTRLEGEYDPELMDLSFIREQMDPEGASMQTYNAQKYANDAIAQGIRARDFANSTKPEDVAHRARVRANSLNDNTLQNVSAQQYASPDFLHWTKGNAVNDLGRDPSAGHAPSTENAIPSSRWAGGSDTSRLRMRPMPLDSVEDAIRKRYSMNPFLQTADNSGFDPAAAVRNMGQLPMQMDPSRINRTEAGVMPPPLDVAARTSLQGMPIRPLMKRPKQRVQGQGYQYPNIPFGNQI